jgi:hypothetical protein
MGEVQRKKGRVTYFTQFPPMQYNPDIALKIAALSIVSSPKTALVV